MKSVIFISTILILFSCDFGYNYEDEAKWSLWADEKAPLTANELKFIDSLSKKTCPIEISRTFIGRDGNKSVRYELTIHFDNLTVTETNIDSLDKVRKEIVNELYSKVISDSVIFDLNRIHTHLIILKQEKITEKEFDTYEVYFIDSLEQWNGFKVVKLNKNKFKRLSVQ